MNNANRVMPDRRAGFAHTPAKLQLCVVPLGPTTDRRQQWRDKKDAQDFLALRDRQFEQSAFARNYALDAMEPSF